MNNSININGEGSWVGNINFGNYACALFRVKIIEDWSAWYSYKALNGVMIIRVLKSSADENYYNDIMFRFSTRNATDMTAYVKIFDKDAENFVGWTYKFIVKNDGYGYFYVKGSNIYENYKCQMIFSSYPGFVEMLDGANLITSAEFTNPIDSIQVVTPSKGGLGSGNVSAISAYAEISTATNFIPLEHRVINGKIATLTGYCRLYSNCAKLTPFLTISIPPIGNKPVIIYCDVYESYTSEALSDFDSTKIKRKPFVFNNNGTICPLYDAIAPSYLYFNFTYKYRT